MKEEELDVAGRDEARHVVVEEFVDTLEVPRESGPCQSVGYEHMDNERWKMTHDP